MSDQLILFGLLGVVFGLLIWAKDQIRYDLVAFCALVFAIIVGVVPGDQAFSGFGHNATVVVALVLVISKGMSNSGAIEWLARHVIDSGRTLVAHISVMSGLSALLSAVMNNVAALALLMPIDMDAAKKAKRSAALTLMPLSFASILGGMITLIGTPPNIIIAAFREQAVGAPFGMFDFSPVGAVVALAGVLFIALVGWRLIPVADKKEGPAEALDKNIEEYISEVRVGEKSSLLGLRVREIGVKPKGKGKAEEELDVAVRGLVRSGKRLAGGARAEVIGKGDILVIEAKAPDIDAFVGAYGLEYVGSEKHRGLAAEGLKPIEVVVPANARIEGRSEESLQLLYRYGVTLLGVSRQGKAFRDRVRKLEIQAGDILLLLGTEEQLLDVVSRLGCLPLKERDLPASQRQKAPIAAASFAVAIGLATAGLINLPEALALVCIVMVGYGIVPFKEIYSSIEWPVIVFLGSMIPIGAALEAAGGTALLAQTLVDFAAAYGPVLVLTLLMVATMTLSDVLNNTATAVIAAPIAIDIAQRLQVSPDPFLMAVAIAASCAFLTPIGHQNNTLILGPGGYKPSDFWRLGLPLELLVIAISIPMILLVWGF